MIVSLPLCAKTTIFTHWANPGGCLHPVAEERIEGKADTRSSYYLEDAATEFQIQGLELDWIGVTWDADLRRASDGWRFHEFRGKSWNKVSNGGTLGNRQRYLLNAYRVLLTRARQGMVIFVPPGDPSDPTRKPDYYDETYDYLAGLGLSVL